MLLMELALKLLLNRVNAPPPELGMDSDLSFRGIWAQGCREAAGYDLPSFADVRPTGPPCSASGD
jgi:hypothetical protein